jgi:hypothetical protein
VLSQLAHLPEAQQQQVLSQKQRRVHDQQMAAATIERFLAQHSAQRIDLAELPKVIASPILKPSEG